MKWFLPTALIAYVLPHIQTIKVVIDGTIDFGPNWNFEYKISPGDEFENREAVSAKPNVLRSIGDMVLSLKDNENDASEVIADSSRNTDGVLAEDSSDDKVVERVYEATRMYEVATKPDTMFRSPRKIKREKHVTKFLDHIKTQSLRMFDKLREKLKGDAVKKLNELKERYVKKFGEFQNKTKQHTIKTTIGKKNVILNTIDYSNRLLSRLGNRFKIDMEQSGSRTGPEATKAFDDHKDELKTLAYEDACKRFGICRAGNELSDHVSELIKTLLEHNDTQLWTAAKATADALKNANFSRIMDNETELAFNKALSRFEELTPFEMRVLLITYKLLIDKRHEPFLQQDNQNEWILPTVAVFHVLEGINKKVIIDPADWQSIKEDVNKWFAGEKVDVRAVVQKLVDKIQKNVSTFDAETAKDFKDKLKMSIAARPLRISLSNYVQFQPFVV